jgi:hypothetical protein
MSGLHSGEKRKRSGEEVMSKDKELGLADDDSVSQQPVPHLLRSLSSFRVAKVVGQGTFGVVFKAIDCENEEQVALKKIKMEQETQGFPITVNVSFSLNGNDVFYSFVMVFRLSVRSKFSRRFITRIL